MKHSYKLVLAVLGIALFSCGAEGDVQDGGLVDGGPDDGGVVKQDSGVVDDSGFADDSGGSDDSGVGNGFGKCSDPCPPDVDVIGSTCDWTPGTSIIGVTLAFREAVDPAPLVPAIHEVSFSNGNGGDEFVMRISVSDTGARCDAFLKDGGQAVFPRDSFTCDVPGDTLRATMDTSLVTGTATFNAPFSIFEIYSNQKDENGIRKIFEGPTGDPIGCTEL